MMRDILPLHEPMRQYIGNRTYRRLLRDSDLSTQAKVARTLYLVAE